MAKAKDESGEVINSTESTESATTTTAAASPASIELGEFQVMHVDEHKANLTHEKSVSNFVFRIKGPMRQLERGATYMLTATRVEPAPEEGMITVEVPASEAHNLPPGSKGMKDK